MNQYWLGLEWLNDQIKLACLKKNGDKYQLISLERLAFPANKPESASKILSEWIDKNLPQNSQVKAVVTLPESSIFLKELELPQAKNKQLTEAIFWEVSSIAPISPNQAVIQWKKISEEEETVHLGAMVAKSETVQDLSDIFKKANLQLLAIEPSSIAFTRLTRENLEKTTLLIVAEDPETNFVILKNGVPIFSNAVPIDLFGMKTKKRRMDQKVATALATNAKKVISYWEAKEKGKVEQVIVTGRGIRYSGLARKINHLVHLPAVFGKTRQLAKIDFSTQPKTKLNRYLIPLGAAVKLLREEYLQETNLLPSKERKTLEKEKSQKMITKKIFAFAKVTLLFLLVNFSFLAGLKFWNTSLTKNISQTKIFVEHHPAQKLIQEIKAANQLLTQVDRLMTNQKDIGQRLRQISQLTPREVTFDSLELKIQPKEEWEISGIGDRDDILAFYEKLKIDSGAREVTMPYSNLQKEKEGEFTISLIW